MTRDLLQLYAIRSPLQLPVVHGTLTRSLLVLSAARRLLQLPETRSAPTRRRVRPESSDVVTVGRWAPLEHVQEAAP